MVDKIYVGDTGTVLKVDCEVDISDATLAQIHVQKPDGETEVQWTGTITGGKYIQYTTIEGDLDQIGYYYAQSYIETPSGKWHGEMFNFQVYALYK